MILFGYVTGTMESRNTNADKAFAKLLDTMSATEALTVATIINEAPVPPGMFVSKELPPRVSGEDLVIDVEGILRSVKKTT